MTLTLPTLALVLAGLVVGGWAAVVLLSPRTRTRRRRLRHLRRRYPLAHEAHLRRMAQPTSDERWHR